MSFWGILASVIPLDLLTGLKTTGKHLFARKVTVQYPEQRQEPSPRFRGMFGYSLERCNVCRGCEKACPINIIHIESHWEEYEVDGKKRKRQVIDRYDIDVKRCMFCNLCAEACPTEAIWLTTKTYEAAAYERNQALYFDKDKLMRWDGIKPFPGVKPPAEGGLPLFPIGGEEDEEEDR